MDSRSRYRLKAGIRQLNRVRWARKLTHVRGVLPGGTATTVDKLSYVAWGPELGDYSFDIADNDAVAQFLGPVLSQPPEAVRAAIDEAYADEPLHEDYARARRRALLPRYLALSQRSLWWAIVRLRKPKLIVEAGVWYGLGSAVLLRALELNAQEGHEGRLMSFDPDPTAGWLVPARLRDRWTWIQATTEAALETHLRGHQLDFFIEDTPHNYARERAGYEVALRFSAPGAVLISSNGENTTALADACDAHGLPYHHKNYLPRRHFYVSNGVALTVVPADEASEPGA